MVLMVVFSCILDRRILEKKLTPVFAKYGMEFKCEMVDLAPSFEPVLSTVIYC